MDNSIVITNESAAGVQRESLLIIAREQNRVQELQNLFASWGYEVTLRCETASSIDAVDDRQTPVAVVELRSSPKEAEEFVRAFKLANPAVRLVVKVGPQTSVSSERLVALGAFACVNEESDDATVARAVHLAWMDSVEERLLEHDKATGEARSSLLHSEEDRQRLKNELHRSHRLEVIGLLTDGMAHDFNNLLTVIVASTERLSGMLKGHPAALSVLEMMEQAADQAVEVTRSLLAVSRNTPTEKRSVDLHQVAKDSLRLLRRVLPAEIELAGDMGLPKVHFVKADAARLRQAIISLAINARDAMPKGGTLRIAIQGQDQQAVRPASNKPIEVALRVTCDAKSIEKEAPTERSRDRKLVSPQLPDPQAGLPIVHEVAKEHGGHFEVARLTDHATEYVLSLPVLKPTSTANVRVGPRSIPSGQGNVILFAEDTDLVSTIVITALCSRDYEVLHARNGDTLTELYHEHRERISLFILDVSLPIRSGLDFLADARSQGDDRPAIIITGNDSNDVRDRLGSSDTLLLKPFPMSELGDSIGKLLGLTDAATPGLTPTDSTLP